MAHGRRGVGLRPSNRRVGMALYGDLTFDSRVRREAATLARAGYEVTIACLAGDHDSPDLPEGIRVVHCRPTASAVLPGTPSPFMAPARSPVDAALRRFGWLRDYVRNLRAFGRLAVASAGPVDLWHLHDLTGLAAVAPLVRQPIPIVYDAHELFLATGTARRLPGIARSLLRKYERRLVARSAAVLTVNDALADALVRSYRPRRIVALHNCPDPWIPPAQRPTLIREATGIPVDEPVLLYHGALSIHRGIEQLMEALRRPGLERAHLVLLGFGEKRDDYVAAAETGSADGRVHVLDPVAPARLLDWVASADIGVMPIQASTLNHYLSTPNKLFECLAAGIPVVASDFPAVRRIVVDDPIGPLGVACDPSDVDAVAAGIRSLLDLDVAATADLRSRCLAAARDRWNWEIESRLLVDLYRDLLTGADRAADPDRPDAPVSAMA